MRLPSLQRVLRRATPRPRRRHAPPASELGASAERCSGCARRSSATSAASRSRCTGATASARTSCSSAARSWSRSRRGFTRSTLSSAPSAPPPARPRTSRCDCGAPLLSGLAVLRELRPAGRCRRSRRRAVTERGPARSARRCGAAARPGQEYCLECGSRLTQTSTGPVDRASARVAETHPWAAGWVVPSLLGLVIAVLGRVRRSRSPATARRPA